jgi:site-specific recombinase XerD
MTENSAHLTAQTLLQPTLQAWERYLTDQGRSTNTIKAFMSDLRILTEFLPPDRPIGAITTEDLVRYFDWMEKERGIPCSPKTLARRITSTKSFFRWLNQYGVLLIDPGEKVPNRSVLSPLPIVLTEEEKQAALDAANKHRFDEKPDARSMVLLLLLLTTGIKKSECLGIHLNHIELDDPEGPYVFIRYASPANRYKERKIPLTEEWIEIYHEYVAQYEPVDQFLPWSQRRLEYLLEDIGEEAGLNKHLSFDMCRWTSSLTDYKSGVEHDRIRQKLGISKIQWREIRMKLRKLSRNE